MNFKKLLFCMAGFVALSTASANAYTVVVSEGLTSGSGINAGPASAFTCGAANVACATFTYTGLLNFNNTAAQNSTNNGDLNSAFGFSNANVSGYSGSGTVAFGGPNATAANFSDLTHFLASSGSISNFGYASDYNIDLGVLAAGTVLTITHDDGIALFNSSVAFGPTVAGPTSATTDTVVVGANGDVHLWYTRQNGTPSILQVSVPEPLTISLFGAGLVGAGAFYRRRKAAKKVA